MTTSILALELIAPLIGGAVLTGAFGFFSGLVLARKGADDSPRHRHHQSRFRSVPITPVATPVTSTPKNMVPTEVSTGPSLGHRFRELIQKEDIGSSLSALLQWIVRDPVSGFAAIVGTRPEVAFVTVSEGLSKLSADQLTISSGLIERLKLENPLLLNEDAEYYNLLRWLTEDDRKKAQQISLTGLDDGNGLFAVLIASVPWPAEHDKVEQRQLMKMVADYTSSHWSHLLTLERQAQELRSTRDMLELHSIIDSQTVEPAESLQQFAIRLCDMVNADRVSVYFVARRLGEQLQPIVQGGNPYPIDHEMEGLRQEQLLAEIAIESQAGHLRDSEDLPTLENSDPIASSVTLPICVNGRVLGALCTVAFDDRGALLKGRKLIEFAAEILSKALARVFDEATVRRQAHHDHLTDLINRRSLDAQLSEEVERIQKGESSACSLILADLDRFKSFNDQFGHQCGDQVLKETARVLAAQVSQLRAGEYSLVARYGGEEFAILLPNVGMAGALRIAEGIRAAIEAERIQIGDAVMQITLSLGVAAMPDQATSVESFIAAADKALYQAKADGRNCVRHAESFAVRP